MNRTGREKHMRGGAREAARAGVGPPDLTSPEGFGEFYEEHVDAVLGFVTRRVADPHLAADLTADIFLAALKAAPSFRADRGLPRAWLYGIARNVLASHARGHARERDAVARLSGRRLLDDGDVAALEERIDAQRAYRELAERHAALSEPLRAVLDLVVVDGLDQAEAATALGVTRATVRVRLHRARRALRHTAPTRNDHQRVAAHRVEAAG
ncbi:RNA polymerase sigma factor [Streptomyces globosus]|uniref:RNA polymerase sigma factor n=1 Tax=Streptomyces globosus TaxID=68209 RepID=UPI0031D27BA2